MSGLHSVLDVFAHFVRHRFSFLEMEITHSNCDTMPSAHINAGFRLHTGGWQTTPVQYRVISQHVILTSDDVGTRQTRQILRHKRWEIWIATDRVDHCSQIGGQVNLFRLDRWSGVGRRDQMLRNQTVLNISASCITNLNRYQLGKMESCINSYPCQSTIIYDFKEKYSWVITQPWSSPGAHCWPGTRVLFHCQWGRAYKMRPLRSESRKELCLDMREFSSPRLAKQDKSRPEVEKVRLWQRVSLFF